MVKFNNNVTESGAEKWDTVIKSMVKFNNNVTESSAEKWDNIM